MSDNLIEKAMELATSGSAKEAIETLWPLIHNEETRGQAMFTLAFCFERDNNFATAVYLYQQVVDADSENGLAAERMAYCQGQADQSGLFEDFSDLGHLDCPCGVLRQRAEYGACPYCGKPREGKDPLAPVFVEEAEEALPGWDDGSFMERLENAADTAAEKIKVWSEREEVKEFSARLGQVKGEISETTKHVLEHEKVKASTESLQKTGEQASEKITEFLESDAVRDAARKVREKSHDVIERTKALADSESMKETTDRVKKIGKKTGEKIDKLVEDPRVKGAADRVRETGEGILDAVRGLFVKKKDDDQ